ncbi:uncharacterized protein LOC106470877 [Limulus polyphemus]|uniref:Uncharacterized protein LOC106470877 n=1 Tax=Limulus polyphemus TaxID=6850 RepID=A0ABM1BQY3_LIMPO|nr:uncharacterized protein LOC106470877 [Limulus polyphemus]
MTTPICRCRVLYLGSAVSHITKDGLQGLQEPLRVLYPGRDTFNTTGIDSWLSVWSNGILLENVDKYMRQMTRFFPIESLYYCAAIRNVVVQDIGGDKVETFLPLDSLFVRQANSKHPPLFACILRRTTKMTALECHAFICKKDAAANAIVRCCFHAYTDNIQARQLEESPHHLETRRSLSISGLDTFQRVEDWRYETIDKGYFSVLKSRPASRTGREMCKLWMGSASSQQEVMYSDNTGTVSSGKSLGNNPFLTLSPNVVSIPGKEIKSKAMIKKLFKPKKKEDSESTTIVTKGMLHGPSLITVPSGTSHSESGLYTERRRKEKEQIPIPPTKDPTFLSSARPITLTASYQPGTFPYESYFLQHYGTAPRPPKVFQKKTKGGKEKTLLELPFNTGIYRKKGHINERAFSFSICEEHRSRSNSLANFLSFFEGSGDSSDYCDNTSISYQTRDKRCLKLSQMVKSLELKEN